MKRITIKQGVLEGIDRGSHILFAGIPYAKAPVGDLRWRAPQPPNPWEGVFYATSWPNRCMQDGDRRDSFYEKEFYDDSSYQTPISEDGLYLNVWTPSKRVNEKLPVAVWIHGGAFMGGFGHEKEFDGQYYCEQGVILVTINYRLGVMGFFAHPWLSAESERGISGNYGILDQIAALRWVRENIEAFGGDSSRITIFGQSAGGMSVQTLVTSPVTKGMVVGAILQSGMGLGYDHTLEQAEKEGVELTQKLGVKSLKELRCVPFDQLLRASQDMVIKGMMSHRPVFSPVIDGYILKEGYESAYKNGRIHDIPYMIGSTKHDIATDRSEISQGRLGCLYDACDDWCDTMAVIGSKPIYRYYFSRELPGDKAGAFHSSELWYMFGTYSRCWRPMTEGDSELSSTMVRYWTNFIKSGNPNSDGIPQWKPWNDGRTCMILDLRDEREK